MQESVHVWVGERRQELRLVLLLELHCLVACLRVGLIEALIHHQLLHLCLNLFQMEQTRLIFTLALDLFGLLFFRLCRGSAALALSLFTLSGSGSFRFFFVSFTFATLLFFWLLLSAS